MAKETAIGDLLVRSGIIDATGLARAQEAQDKNGISLSRAVTTLGLADEEGVVAIMAKSMRLESLESELPEIPSEVVALLPADFCRKRAVVPLSLQGKTLRLALRGHSLHANRLPKVARFMTQHKYFEYSAGKPWRTHRFVAV